MYFSLVFFFFLPNSRSGIMWQEQDVEVAKKKKLKISLEGRERKK